jgi:hypothetical protein
VVSVEGESRINHYRPASRSSPLTTRHPAMLQLGTRQILAPRLGGHARSIVSAVKFAGAMVVIEQTLDAEGLTGPSASIRSVGGDSRDAQAGAELLGNLVRPVGPNAPPGCPWLTRG